VVKLNVQEATTSSGDVIAVIDSIQYEEEYVSTQSSLHELEAELEVKKAELAALERNPLPKDLWNAKTNLEECKATAERTAGKLERYKKLDNQSAISKKEFEAAEIENIQAQADYQRAIGNYSIVKSGLGDKYIEKAQREIDLVKARITAARGPGSRRQAHRRMQSRGARRRTHSQAPLQIHDVRGEGKVAATMATASP
jgi:multidrug resistance efflux pump